MNDLKISIENSGGIIKLQQLLEFNDSTKIHLVYAQNGSGKSSLTRAIDPLTTSIGHLNGKPELLDITLNGGIINESNCYTYHAFNGNLLDLENHDITNFIGTYRQKSEYDSLYKPLEKLYSSILSSTLEGKNFKRGSDINDVLKLIAEVFGIDINNVMQWLIKDDTIKMISKANPSYQNDAIRYATLSLPSTEKLLKKHGVKLKKFTDTYEKLKQVVPILSDEFNLTNISRVSKSLNDEKYFAAKHKIQLTDKDGMDFSEQISDAKTLDELISKVTHEIISDSKALLDFKSFESDLNKKENVELKMILDNIETESIILDMVDHANLLRNAWYSYFQPSLDKIYELKKEYDEKKDKLANIISEAANEITIWDTIIADFNRRFRRYPIKPDIKNKKDYLLGREITTTVVFYYNIDGIPTEIESKKLGNYLSTGEKRVFNLLQLIYQFKQSTSENNFKIFVLDDVVDSFDYANKYGTVSYLLDIAKDSHIGLILLTHNFDFYRLVNKRSTENMCKSWIFSREKESFIEDTQDELINRIKNNITGNNEKSIYNWFCLIAIARNVCEYGKECGDGFCHDSNHLNCTSYFYLSEALHYRTGTSTTLKQVADYVEKILNPNKSAKEIFNDEQLEKRCSEFIVDIAINTNPVDILDIAEKTVISFASRILAEKCINKITGLGANGSNMVNYTKWCKDNNVEPLKEIEDVFLFSPEHIHINSFMYEPLIDLSVSDIMNSYNAIKLKVDTI